MAAAAELKDFHGQCPVYELVVDVHNQPAFCVCQILVTSTCCLAIHRPGNNCVLGTTQGEVHVAYASNCVSLFGGSTVEYSGGLALAAATARSCHVACQLQPQSQGSSTQGILIPRVTITVCCNTVPADVLLSPMASHMHFVSCSVIVKSAWSLSLPVSNSADCLK